MDSRQELLKKLQILVQEIDKAKNDVDDEKIKYLNNYKSGVENVIAKLQDGILPASKGGRFTVYAASGGINPLTCTIFDPSIFGNSQRNQVFHISPTRPKWSHMGKTTSTHS